MCSLPKCYRKYKKIKKTSKQLKEGKKTSEQSCKSLDFGVTKEEGWRRGKKNK